LRGADAFDSFLAITRHPLAKFLELGLVLALALHMALGLRVLAIEFLPWRERTAAMVSTCVAASLAIGLLFLLNAA
jgi:fumarate reductase subunit D